MCPIDTLSTPLDKQSDIHVENYTEQNTRRDIDMRRKLHGWTYTEGYTEGHIRRETSGRQYEITRRNYTERIRQRKLHGENYTEEISGIELLGWNYTD